LNPSEFTATNGTTVVLAQAATLNAQISIVKYVAALSTTAIRNETTFTATSGQTTFSVNYTVGQLDVFYNGSKLNVSEFTATNGTSVVLGFACVAGESVVFVSYVNQVSGASGTANRVAKFTGAATLGDSQIFDNGTNVGIGTVNTNGKLNVLDSGVLSGLSFPFEFASNSNAVSGWTFAVTRNNTSGILLGARSGIPIMGTLNSTNLSALPDGGNLLIGTNTDNGSKFQVNGTSSFSGNVGIGAVSGNGRLRVLDSGIFTGLAFPFEFASSSSSLSGWTFAVTNNNITGVLIGSRSGSAIIGTLNTTNLSIQPDGGKVGVGTTNPTHLLHLMLPAGQNGQILRLSRSAGSYTWGLGTNSSTSSLDFHNDGGTVVANINFATGVYTPLSDKRLKENIVDSGEALQKLLKIKVRKYNWKNSDIKEDFGLIAQELNEVLPQYVQEGNEETNWGVAKAELVPLLVKAIQEQQAQIKELQDEIISLKK
jgi:hypothetical protein